MAAYDFPLAPVVGDEYAPTFGAVYRWNGKVWNIKPAPAPSPLAHIVVADVAPPLTDPDILWWDSDSGNLFVSYQDVDSIAWVQVIAPAAVPPGSGGGITDAPSDGVLYGRQSATWQPVPTGVDGGIF